MALDSVLPKGGFLCPCFFPITMSCFLGFHAFGSSISLPVLLDFGDGLTQSRSKGGGEVFYG